jgi:hypothetical protein
LFHVTNSFSLDYRTQEQIRLARQLVFETEARAAAAAMAPIALIPTTGVAGNGLQNSHSHHHGYHHHNPHIPPASYHHLVAAANAAAVAAAAAASNANSASAIYPPAVGFPVSIVSLVVTWRKGMLLSSSNLRRLDESLDIESYSFFDYMFALFKSR